LPDGFGVAGQHAGEHGEGSGQRVPEAAVVGVRAGVDEQPGRLQRGREADAGIMTGVGLVEQGARRSPSQPPFAVPAGPRRRLKGGSER
jgi:hypothetical protein